MPEPEIVHTTTGMQHINIQIKRTRFYSGFPSWPSNRPQVTHFHLISVANPERRLSRTCAPFRELLWAAWAGCLGDENVSGKFEPSAQFPYLF